MHKKIVLTTLVLFTVFFAATFGRSQKAQARAVRGAAAVTTSTSSDQCTCAGDSTSGTTGNGDDAQTSTTSYSTAIQISELYPAPPTGEEEFIELYNSSSTSVDLADWVLADASGKKYTIAAADFTTIQVGAKGYFVVPQSISKIYFNNSGDNITLYQPNGNILEEASYTNAESGVAWAKVDGVWQWTTEVTEGKKNIGGVAAEETTASAAEQGKSSEEETVDQNAQQLDASKMQSSDAILLNELLPNPAGLDSTDEWLELYNSSEQKVYLGGWQLTDEKDFYTIGDVYIESHEYLVFEVSETKLSLNNSGDEVYLIDPFGKIVQGVSYGDAAEGESWARFDNNWQWTTQLTPTEANVAVDDGGDADNDDGTGGDVNGDGENNDDSEDGSDKDVVSIAYLRTLEDEQTATVEGVITALPDVFGSQYFYIQDEEAGVQVYSYNKYFPEMAVGDRVRVTGQKSTSRNETRLKTSVIEDIEVLESGVEVVTRDASVLAEELEGMLAQVEGQVVEKNSSYIMIDDRVKVVFKSGANLNLDVLTEGASVAVRGIVAQYDEEYRLMPRSDEDITVLEGEELKLVPGAAAAEKNAGTYNLSNEAQSIFKNQRQIILLVVVIVGLLAVIAGMFLRTHWQQVRAKLALWRKGVYGQKAVEGGGCGKVPKNPSAIPTHETTKVATIFDFVKKE